MTWHHDLSWPALTGEVGFGTHLNIVQLAGRSTSVARAMPTWWAPLVTDWRDRISQLPTNGSKQKREAFTWSFYSAVFFFVDGPLGNFSVWTFRSASFGSFCSPGSTLIAPVLTSLPIHRQFHSALMFFIHFDSALVCDSVLFNNLSYSLEFSVGCVVDVIWMLQICALTDFTEFDMFLFYDLLERNCLISCNCKLIM